MSFSKRKRMTQVESVIAFAINAALLSTQLRCQIFDIAVQAGGGGGAGEIICEK